MAKAEEVAGIEVLDIAPELILADSNIRYGLKRPRLDNLKSKILEAGRVTDAIEIEPLEKPEGKAIYRLTVGHYRHAAVTELNKEGAGLTLPAQVVPSVSDLARRKRQISENMDREDLSPMDKAVAMKDLLDMGVSKMDVRTIFAIPGGRKGMKIQPVSNSYVNIHLDFLKFDKKTKEAIHSGEITVTGAMELAKIQKEKPEKFKEVLERIESARIEAIDKEEKEEAKLLAEEAKQLEKAKKAEDSAAKLKEKEDAVTKALELEKAKAAEAAQVFKDAANIKDEKIRLSAETRAKVLEKEAQDAEAKRIKLQGQVKEAAEKIKKQAEAAKVKAAQAKKEADEKKKAAAKPVSKAEVAKAAKEADASPDGRVPLNRTQIMKVLKTMQLPGGTGVETLIVAIGKSLEMCFDSYTTEGIMFKEMKEILTKSPALKAKAEKVA